MKLKGNVFGLFTGFTLVALCIISVDFTISYFLAYMIIAVIMDLVFKPKVEFEYKKKKTEKVEL